MFYEERVMDGRLWSRSTPDGHWQEVKPDIILGRMLLAERQLASLRARADDIERGTRITLREALTQPQV